MGGKVGQIGSILSAVKALAVSDRGWISRRMVLKPFARYPYLYLHIVLM